MKKLLDLIIAIISLVGIALSIYFLKCVYDMMLLLM